MQKDDRSTVSQSPAGMGADIIEANAAEIGASWCGGAVEILRAGGWVVNSDTRRRLGEDADLILRNAVAYLRGEDVIAGQYHFLGMSAVEKLDRDVSVVAIFRLYYMLGSRIWYALYEKAPATVSPQVALDMHQDVLDALRNLTGLSPCDFLGSIEARLTQQQKTIAEVYSNMLDVQENERRRIARDVHDVLAQALAGARFRAETALRLLNRKPEVDVVQLTTELTEVKQLVEYTLAHVRDIIFDLRPAALDRVGLRGAVEEYISRLPNDEIEVTVTGTGQTRIIGEHNETALFRIVQEALANAVNHSDARAACVRIDADSSGATVTIQDTGTGFDVEQALSASGKDGRHYGLLSMRERAEMMGGRFAVESRRGEGTTITVCVPVPSRE